MVLVGIYKYILNCMKELLTLAVLVRSWTDHFSHSCSQRHLLVSFCKPHKLSISLTVPIWGGPIGAQLSFVSTNGSSPPNWDTQRGNWKKRKAGEKRRKVLPSRWKVKRMHQKRIQKLVDICGRANPSKKVGCSQFSLSWDLSKILQPLSGGHRSRLTIRE